MDEDLKRIDAWLAQSGMKSYRLGLLACANARAIDRIRAGSASLETMRQVLDYIEGNPA